MEERTERETVFANPDGTTFTLEKSVAPVRVATQGGGWMEPDATLVKKTDGSVGPKAAAVDLSFSSGGTDGELVTIADGTQSVSLGWPGALPAPRLDGARAVYENVLPDVDLVLTATVEGFRQVLEVKTAEAAANPALNRIEYRLGAENLTVRAGAGGGVDALDGNGRPVFRSPAARMWNSAGDDAAPAAAQQSLYLAGPTQADAGEPVPAGPAEEGDPLAGPGAGDTSSVLDLAVTEKTVTVTPDPELLSATDKSDFPLYIDPSIELNESERTVLSSDGDVFWNFSGGDNGMSVGKCGSAVIGGISYYCGSGYVNRMYFEFDPANLKGKHILDARFDITETWSFSCDARWVDLERTNNISPSSKWPGPTKLDQMGDRNVSAGRGSNCSPSQPRAPIKFHDNAAEPDENLTPTVRNFAAGKISRLTLMLMAKDEKDTVSWKRFDDDAVLSVDYVGKPAKPSAIGLVTGSSQTCTTNESAPAIATDPTPALTATTQTESGGERGASLRIVMSLDKKTGTTWTKAVEDMLVPSTPVGDNFKATDSFSATLEENTVYRYRAWIRSYYGSQYLAGPSNASTTGWCYFKVDSKAPKPPTITFNATGPYSLCLPNACVPGGKPGQAGSFTLGPAAGDVNTAYRYKLSTDTAWSAYVPGATVKIAPVPPTSGTITLDVEAKDNNGPGADNSVDFVVKEGDGPVGRWNFHDTGNEAVDSSTTDPKLQDNATLAGGAVRTTQGRRGEITVKPATESTPAEKVTDNGLSLNGTTGYAATAGPVIDTRASYTVAAWVRLGSASQDATVLGQNGVNRSPFHLGYEQSTKKWSFREATADTPAGGTPSYQRVSSKNQAVPKVWTHLAGVFNSMDKTISLYVNGRLQGTTPFAASWAATGPLQIGRAQSSGTYADYFPGVVDEAAVWQEALTDLQVKQESRLLDADRKPAAELVASWNPAQATGTSLTNSAPGYDGTLSLSSGASLVGDELVLDGTAGAGSASGPVVDDSGSFTVTTQAVVDAAGMVKKPDGYRAQILGQRTATGSSWSLWFEKTGTRQEPALDENDEPVIDENGNPVNKTVPVGQWHFGRLTADGTGASVVSGEDAVLDSEVRLTGIYDAQDGTIQLYLTADPQSKDPVAYTAQVGTGEFSVGKGYLGAWGNYLPGRIGDIRIWSGALGDEAQVSDIVGT
ncbi:LamG domain-containing protein [Streptomyces sp. NBC_00439]|uniref:LamG domain-containing protein n=1 Tax=Streptomyces sp. NBC_00439 TaxID=2903650 RepID=UPI002253989E|nr:LamG domain-containing protein [Streptomyces sp. NBC_00439]MCX5105618.1 LamG domain-containing protein [Streptomyces sp. NBC_00439]